MNKYFSLNDTIYDITEQFPELIDFLAKNGFSKLANPSLRKLMGKQITLENALKSKHYDLINYEQKMVEVIENNQNHDVADVGLVESIDINADIQVDGVLPCPMRIPLLDALNQWKSETNSSINFNLQSASMGIDWLQEKIANIDDSDELADIYLSAGYDLFFGDDNFERFARSNVFNTEELEIQLREKFSQEPLKLQDPNYTRYIIACVPAVFVINKNALADRPIPQSWFDLMKPEFKNSLSLPVKDLEMFNALLLGIYSKYGYSGIEKLGANLLNSMHPAQMTKIQPRLTQGPQWAVSVMPYFITDMMSENPLVEIVWPSDGAILNPIFLTIKKTSLTKVKP
ncbi:MAG: ABC transporter substrate-binding protein, partial [Erysipelotrichaceae bacterium]